MKITAIEQLHADAGLGHYSFLKISTDEGLVGWSEFHQSGGGKGLSGVIEAISEQLIGQDPLPVQKIATQLYQQSIQAPGGLNQRANATIELALWDIKGKALGVPVYALFGGAVRDRVEVYWSHCGSYRMMAAEKMGLKPVRTLHDIAELGAEVRERGFLGLKTNCFKLRDGQLSRQMQGYGRQPGGYAALNLDAETLAGVAATMAAFRDGAGPQMNLHLDANFHFKAEGYIRVAKAIAPSNTTWLEMDVWDPTAMADIRRNSPVPIAALESVVGRRAFRPYLENRAVDYAIVDILWNGWSEALKIASMVESYEISCAPHNYHGHLSTAIAAHFCAVVPNIKVMEVDVDGAPRRDDLFVEQIVFENGEIVVPTGPGWGMNVNEAAVRRHAADK